nr:hypothetical protein BaRGS_003837 [Batillaria attramentaria]
MAAGQKKKRQTPKRDLRLLKSTIKPKAEEVKKSICSFAYLVTAVKTLSLVLFYYFFSITLTFYNQRFIHSTQFNMEGFVMVMLASILSGLRWTLAQIVLQKHEIGLHHPLDMMYHIQPWMILTLLPLAATAEGLKLSSTELVFRFNDIDVLAKNLGLVLLGAVLAFFLEFSEFLLLCMTSSLTLSISGIFKELCVLYLAVYVNGDKISAVNGIGLIVCLAGISLHVILKAVYGHQTITWVFQNEAYIVQKGA